MIESGRPEHSLNFGELTFDQDGEVFGDKGKIRCPWCELDLRRDGWSEMSDRERTENPDYCIWEQ
eukprot:8407231-Prorocentrum_lima.AAC.1